MSTLAETSLTQTERRVVDRIVVALRDDLGDELDAIWLYGSRARGEPPREESDVDLIVLIHEPSPERARRVYRSVWDAKAAEDAWEHDFAARVADREWIANRRAIRSFFIQEVDRDKVVLYGDP